MRRRKRVAHGTEVGRGSTQNPRPCHLRPCAMLLAPLPHGLQAVCSALRHPVSKGWGVFSYFYPYLLDASPVYNVLRYPFVKGWGIYGNFLPYLPEALPLYGPLRHPTSKGMGVFRDFYPYLWQTPGTCATLFPSSKVQPLNIKLDCRTPQRRFLYGTVSRVPRVQKDAGFLYRMYPQAVRVQERTLFCTGRRIASRL